jgi:FkbM family methyltransferase
MGKPTGISPFGPPLGVRGKHHMTVFDTLKAIAAHPVNKGHELGAFSRYLKWQIGSRLNPHPVVYPFVENSKLIIWKGLTGATGNIYMGLHEFEDMAFVLHFLRPDDLFVDIGANVGSYTVLAASVVGASTISIEPVPSTYDILLTNIKLNNCEQIAQPLNIALGSEKTALKFTRSFGTENHVALDNELDTVEVPVEKFDDLMADKMPVLIKMDVEGFETEVLKGMEKSLENHQLKAIIIELNGSGKRYGYDESKIHEKLLSHNFTPYQYRPFERELVKVEKYGTHNTIYISDIDFVKNRAVSARKFKVLAKSI